jgi:hypothetical protein
VLGAYIIAVEPSSRLYSFAAGCMNMAIAVEVAGRYTPSFRDVFEWDSSAVYLHVRSSASNTAVQSPSHSFSLSLSSVSSWVISSGSFRELPKMKRM